MTVKTNSRKVVLLAGNGFIGRQVALTLAADGREVAVHHTGRNAVPDVPKLTSIVVERTPTPILSFPHHVFSYNADVAVHFYCMGAEDAAAFVRAFDGKVRRLVLVSSCDVYRAYGRFVKTEPGPPDPTPLDESAPLRERLYPYRSKANDTDQLEYWYDKLEAERIVSAAKQSEFVIARLPKVYGPAGNNGLKTIYGFAYQPSWRWTHGYVDNVASAIALVAFHTKAAGQIFNLGELRTPTTGERLTSLPQRSDLEPTEGDYDFRQDLHCDTSKIRRLLGYMDVVSESDAMKAVA